MHEVDVRIHKEDKKGNVFTLLKGIRFFQVRASKYLSIRIPKGFESDGASVPRFFWRFVFPSSDTHALYAAFVHDFVYRKHPLNWTKELADRVFFELLVEDGIAPWRARLAYIGVCLFGKKAWNAGGQDND